MNAVRGTLWRRWVDLVHVREPVVGLALFRIAIGLVVAWPLTRIGVTGAGSALWLPVEDGGIGIVRGDWRVAALGGPSPGSVGLLVALAISGSLLVSVGLGTRVAALVAGQALIGLLALVPESGGGHDRLLTNALWLLVLAPSDGSLSLACRLRTGRWVDPEPRAAIVRHLAMLQLVVVYTTTGWQKLGPEWWPWGGLTAVYRSLLQPEWARHDLTWIAQVFPLTRGMTAVTMLWECGFPLVPLWLWGRTRWPALRRFDVRALFLAVGLGVHGTLELASDLGPFAWATVAWYPCFVDAEEWRGLAISARGFTSRFTSRFRRSPPRTTP